MILYASSLSPYARKVLAFAGEKGLELELRPTGTAPGQRSEEFVGASPFGKMPAFRDGDYTLADFERDHPLFGSEISRAPADPERSRASRKDHLVRGVRRHDTRELRSEDFLQLDRGAPFSRQAR